jgi:hypothetical protein
MFSQIDRVPCHEGILITSIAALKKIHSMVSPRRRVFTRQRPKADILHSLRVSRDSADEIEFSNNSSIRVATSMRSGTLQFLHISEYGQLCTAWPEKAREVRTGALNTIQAGQVVFIESTASGHEGHFYELCEAAQANERIGAPLTALDFKFNFFPWWKAPEYSINPTGVVIDDNFRSYFDTLEKNHGIVLRPAQQAWYAKKADIQLEDMKREYPSTPEKAFAASIEGRLLFQPNG